MADQKSTSLTELTGSVVDVENDVFYCVDVSAGESGHRKASFRGVGSAYAALRVETIAALKALTVSKLANNSIVAVGGYYSNGDGGGGLYYYSSASAASADNGAVIAPTAGSGRYLLIHQGTVSVKQWGAYGDGATDDTTTCQAALTYATATGGLTVVFPTGTYSIATGPLNIGSDTKVVIRGTIKNPAGTNRMLLRAGDTSAMSYDGSRDFTTVASDIQIDGEGVGIVDQNSPNSTAWEFSNPNATNTSHCVYARSVSRLKIKNLNVINANIWHIAVDLCKDVEVSGCTVNGDSLGNARVNVTAISTLARAANVVTVTTGANHGLATGDHILISGTTLDGGSFNTTDSGAITVTGATTYTFSQTGANVGAAAPGGTPVHRYFNSWSGRDGIHILDCQDARVFGNKVRVTDDNIAVSCKTALMYNVQVFGNTCFSVGQPPGGIAPNRQLGRYNFSAFIESSGGHASARLRNVSIYGNIGTGDAQMLRVANDDKATNTSQITNVCIGPGNVFYGHTYASAVAGFEQIYGCWFEWADDICLQGNQFVSFARIIRFQEKLSRCKVHGNSFTDAQVVANASAYFGTTYVPAIFVYHDDADGWCDVAIEDNTFTNLHGSAIWHGAIGTTSKNATNVRVVGNTVKNAATGVTAATSSAGTINVRGALLADVTDNVIDGSQIKGINVPICTIARVNDNRISNIGYNAAGTDKDGISISEVAGTQMTYCELVGNDIKDTDAFGIRIVNPGGLHLVGNSVRDVGRAGNAYSEGIHVLMNNAAAAVANWGGVIASNSIFGSYNALTVTDTGIAADYTPTNKLLIGHNSLVASNNTMTIGQYMNFAVKHSETTENRGDVAVTLTYGRNAELQYFNSPLTAGRLVTLASDAPVGAKFRVVRSANATGAFNLDVGGIRTLATAGEWCEVTYHTSGAWVVTAYGTL